MGIIWSDRVRKIWTSKINIHAFIGKKKVSISKLIV